MTTPHDIFEDPMDRRLDAELRALPDLEAPASLVPNVMQAILARQAAAARAPWYRRPATTWPSSLRVAFGLVTLSTFAALIFGAQALWPSVTSSVESGTLATYGDRASRLWSVCTALIDALALVLRVATESPWFLAGVAIAVAAYLTLVGAGSALWRFAAHHPLADE